MENLYEVAGRNAVLEAWALLDDTDPLRPGAKAREDTRLLRIGRDDFYDLLAEDSEITAAVFRPWRHDFADS